MRKLLRGISASSVLLFMLLTYISASLMILLGLGYFTSYKNNGGDVRDYAGTSTFKKITTENFDALYNAINSDGKVVFPYDDNLAYFAYSANTELVICSDPAVYDIPTFESLYLNNKSYVYYCRYAAGTFRGAGSASGETIPFEVSYQNSGTELFNGEQRNYENSAIILAVMEPEYSFEGYGFAKLEYLLLKSGAQYLLMTLGVFLVSFGLTLAGGASRRRIDKAVASAVSWIYFEIKLVLLAAAAWKLYSISANIDVYFIITALAVAVPVLYILKCNALNAPHQFFKKSISYDLYRYLRSLYDVVVPVMPLQVKLRKQVLSLFIFGFLFPAALFFVCDAILGLPVLRLLIPFYILYFGLLFALFLRRYSILVNDISELTRFSSALPLGDRMPEIDMDEKNDLFELKSNISRIDESVAAAADLKYRQSNKKMAEIISSLNELREQSGLLREYSEAEGGNKVDTAEITSVSRRISSISDKIQDTIMLDSPVSAPVLKRIDFLGLLDDVMNSKLAELAAAQLKIHAKLPPPPAYITADMSHIRTALDILLSNLAMYALSGSDVEMVLRKEGQIWRFIIVNTESPYACSEKETSTLATGLSLAKEYLALNGGRLEYTSDGNKFGVSFVLPVAH